MPLSNLKLFIFNCILTGINIKNINFLENVSFKTLEVPTSPTPIFTQMLNYQNMTGPPVVFPVHTRMRAR